MSIPPEAQLLIINAVILAVAYLGIYPSIRNLTTGKLMAADLVLSSLSLLVAGALFWGTGAEFSLLLFSTNWFVFAFLTMFLMELPLGWWFARRRGLNPFNIDQD